jgi:hypothetical protein
MCQDGHTVKDGECADLWERAGEASMRHYR